MKILAPLISLSLLFGACSKDAEDYKETWKEQNDALKAYQDKYPAFSAPMAKNLTQAEGLWKESDAITDKEQKLAKMKEAHDVLSTVLDRLKKVESKRSDIKHLMSRIRSTKVSGLKKLTAQSAMTLGTSTLNRVISNLSTARTYEETAPAASFLDSQLTMLQNTHRRIQDAYKSIKPRSKAKKKKSSEKNNKSNK